MDCHGRRFISGNASKGRHRSHHVVARLGHISRPYRLPYKEDAELKGKRRKTHLSFTSISLGRYLRNYFQFRRNKLRKEDKKRWWENIGLKVTKAGRGCGAETQDCQEDWYRVPRIYEAPHVRHVFSWVNQTLHLLGGNWRASWERWPRICFASGPPATVWAGSNWHSTSPCS